MTRARAVWILLLLWALAFGWSLAAAAMAPVEGKGAAPGFNRLIVFTGWQFVAGAAGGLAFILARSLSPGAPRSLTPAPVTGGFVMIVAVAALAALLWFEVL